MHLSFQTLLCMHIYTLKSERKHLLFCNMGCVCVCVCTLLLVWEDSLIRKCLHTYDTQCSLPGRREVFPPFQNLLFMHLSYLSGVWNLSLQEPDLFKIYSSCIVFFFFLLLFLCLLTVSSRKREPLNYKQLPNTCSFRKCFSGTSLSTLIPWFSLLWGH